MAYIDRDKTLKNIDKAFGDYTKHIDILKLQSDCRASVLCTPAADVVEVKHGEWKRVRFVKCDDPDGGYWIVRCNQCGIPHNKEYNYCPNCGAKMDGGKAE